MAMSTVTTILVLVDILMRRVVLPLVLSAAVIFRYNLMSFLYLIVLLTFELIPGPRLKSQKAASLVLLGILVGLSAVFAVGQALFQITLAVGYDLEPCDGAEQAWRQCGFVQYNISALDVFRHILPDVVVFATSLVALCVTGGVVWRHKKPTDEIQEPRQEGEGENDEMSDLSNGVPRPPFPSTVQCYWKVPKVVLYSLEFAIFVALGLSGIAVPSLISFAYYAFFLLLLVLWSLHLRLLTFVRLLRALVILYSAIHLLLLDLFQFESAQDSILENTMIVTNATTNASITETTESLPARLFGITRIIQTNCSDPTELHVWPDIEFTVYINPGLIVVLFWLLATDLRLWLFTPNPLWKELGTYALPILDQTPSSNTFCFLRDGKNQHQALGTQFGYQAQEVETTTDSGATGTDINYVEYAETKLDGSSTEEVVHPEKERKKITLGMVWAKMVHYSFILWNLFMKVNFIFSIVAMMAWSVFYPSWPDLVLLLWACVIWLIPKVNPRNSLYYTSPLLVIYALLLLMLQYIYSLDLTESELPQKEELEPICNVDGCRSFVLLLKTLFTGVFFASFHEFVKGMKEKWKKKNVGSSAAGELLLSPVEEEHEPTAEDDRARASRQELYASLKQFLSSYWVLVVIGAFLLITLTGEPSLLKTVYLVFFFVFLVTYQIFPRHWHYVNFPLWWLLVVYAVLNLCLVYTYQFDFIQDAWRDAYNESKISISYDDLFDSIGLVDYDYSDVRSLFNTLVLPTIFIAVLAMQLRYFKPTAPRREADTTAGLPSLVLTSFLPIAVMQVIQRPDPSSKGETEETKDGDGSGSIEEVQRPTLRTQKTIFVFSPSNLTPGSKPHKFYRVLRYIILKTKQTIAYLVNLFWRFLELHLHKIITLVLFAVAISQVSAVYWVLIAMLLLVIPFPILNPLTYPLLTLYLGTVTIVKMIYQLPLIDQDDFELKNCSDITEEFNVSGQVFHSKYSPFGDDAAWFGFHKARDADDDFADYVVGPVIGVLLLSLWFTVRQYQASYYRSKEIEVGPGEKGALFLKVTRESAEKSIVDMAKYLVNHFFEMYGVEVCWTMLAITVAVRIDVYGMIYAAALGSLLIIPKRILSPVWLIYLMVHGALLLLQYSFLLGVPHGACFSPDSDREYPWDSVDSSYKVAFFRWFYLSYYVEILDKELLYVDFLVYILVCLQMYYFLRKQGRQGEETLYNFLQLEFWIDYIKVLVFRYSFWVSLFLLFFTAIVRVSLFGVFYLLLCFVFLYHGEEVFKDKPATRHMSWAFIRAVTWMVLLVRVSLQILDCVFFDYTNGCVLLLLFNSACDKNSYYGSPPADCEDAGNIGLWVDALNFAVVTLQIIIFDSPYTIKIGDDLKKKESNAGHFADVFDRKVKLRQQEAKEKKERELQELQDRTDRLSERENRIDHLLHAAVRIPPDIRLRAPRQKPSDKAVDESDAAKLELSETFVLSLEGEEPKRKPLDTDSEASTEESGKLAKAWKFVSEAVLEFVDVVIEWLEKRSALYREVVSELRDGESGQTTEGSPSSTEVQSFAESAPTETKESGVSVEASHVAKQVVLVELHSDEEPAGVDVPGSDREGDVEKAGKEKKVVDRSGSLLLPPTEDEEDQLQELEQEFGEKALQYTKRPKRLLEAVYYACRANSEYVVYFLVILNVIVNGSILSVVYAGLVFLWGLLSVPWPAKGYWLTMIFYTMLIIVVKYGFQFAEINYWENNYDSSEGLYPPQIIGVEYRVDFFTNAVWDLLLLIALLIHRGLLKQSGLWRATPTDSHSSTFVRTWHYVKRFFSRLLNPEISQGGTDYYVMMLFFDILCFVTIVLGVSSFQTTGAEEDNVAAAAQFISTNYIPITFVMMLLLQFLSMLVDRAIYLRHSLTGKFVFYIFLLIVWHIWLFFLLPSESFTGRPFTSNTAAQFIYFFKSCYFLVSALQIVAGYPSRILGYFLGSKYNIVSGLAFRVYRLIPLIPELREVMDWMFTDTSLPILHWLRVQEIYAQIYLVKVYRENQKRSPRDLGEPTSLLVKIVLGGLFVTALVLLIWGPLLAISAISESSEPNPPMAVSIGVSIDGFEPLVEMTVNENSVKSLSREQYRELTDVFDVDYSISRVYKRSDFRRVLFPGESTTLWTISPPAKDLLIRELMLAQNFSNMPVTLTFSWSITREPSNGLAAEVVTGVNARALRNTRVEDSLTIQQFIDTLTNTSNSSTVSLPNLFPWLVYAPSNGPSENFTTLSIHSSVSANASCEVTLAMSDVIEGQEWWSLSQISPHIISDDTGSSSLEMIILSERSVPAIFSFIAGIGIIGLYVSVVFVIGGFIRGFISELPSRLIVDEIYNPDPLLKLPSRLIVVEIYNPDPLLKLCSDIFLVRESKDFKLEEILVGKLFYIFRSPEKLVKLTEDTKSKQD